MFGLHNTKEDYWFGNKEGPLLYEDEELAQAAARILDVRMKNPAGTTRVKIFSENVTYKDEITPERSFDEAMDRLDQGLEL